jgi:hypothetical protein
MGVALPRSEARRVSSSWVKWVRSVEAMGLVTERGGYCGKGGLGLGICVWAGRIHVI